MTYSIKHELRKSLLEHKKLDGELMVLYHEHFGNGRLMEDRELINEAGALIGLIKGFLTSQRGGELATALMKWINKKLGVDKDMDGIRDSCQAKGIPPEDCKELLSQRIANWLRKVHKAIKTIIRKIAAIIIFKTLKVSEVQMNDDRVVAMSDNILKAVLIAFLMMYVKIFGAAIISGNVLLSTLGAIGITTKVSELIPSFRKHIDNINKPVAT